MALISVDLNTSQHSIKLAKRYRNSLFAIVGVHPTEASNCTFNEENKEVSLIKCVQLTLKQLTGLLKSNRENIIAIGECGLDSEKVKVCSKDAYFLSSRRQMRNYLRK